MISIKFHIFLICCSMLVLCKSTNWVASGQFNTDLTLNQVYKIISHAFHQAEIGSIQYSQVASTISSKLTDEWQGAWNVFVIKNSNPKYDTVCMGYAFNDHWLWNNNYYKGYSIILWKDYSCGSRVNVNLTPSSFNQGFDRLPEGASKYLNLNHGPYVDDPWAAANDIIGTNVGLDAEVDPKLTQMTFSGVLLEGIASEFYGTFCTINDQNNIGTYAYSSDLDSANYRYSYLVFQSR